MADSNKEKTHSNLPVEGPAHRTSRDPAEGPRDDSEEAENGTREYTETVNNIQEGPDQRQTRDPAEGARDDSEDDGPNEEK
jgi:hypothetical protein